MFQKLQEDFQPVMYGYKLANDVPEGKASAMMKEVEDELQKRVKVCSRCLFAFTVDF